MKTVAYKGEGGQSVDGSNVISGAVSARARALVSPNLDGLTEQRPDYNQSTAWDVRIPDPSFHDLLVMVIFFSWSILIEDSTYHSCYCRIKTMMR